MDAEVGPFSAAFAFQKSGFANDLHMAGYRGLRHIEDVRELTDAQRAVSDQPHDAPARLVAKGTEKGWSGGIRHESIRNEKYRYVKGFDVSGRFGRAGVLLGA